MYEKNVKKKKDLEWFLLLYGGVGFGGGIGDCIIKNYIYVWSF